MSDSHFPAEPGFPGDATLGESPPRRTNNENKNRVRSISLYTIPSTILLILIAIWVGASFSNWMVFDLFEIKVEEPFLLSLSSMVTFVTWLFLVTKAFGVRYGSVPVGWKAVPLFFKKRSSAFLFSEGFYLIPSLFQDLVKVDTRERLADVSPIEVSVQKELEDGKEVRVELAIDPSIDYIITDPYLFLDVDEFEGKVKSMVGGIIREFVSDKLDSDIFKLKGGESPRGRNGPEKEKEALGAIILVRLDDVSDDWGVKFLRVNFTDIDYDDPELKKAQSAIVLAEIKAAKTNVDAEATKSAMTKLKGDDGTIDDHSALNAVLGSRGELERREILIPGLPQVAQIILRRIGE